ncbi:AMP-binding protein [Amycolatopsis sp. FDAARGOS 1241]|uniref:AMP-binding protein n=1 Tax=Amycolatopsis sp. FDAARGOS 1241 TaxID=2778070 RepID=UPI001EF3AD64|nr:AMP-binding protein [Amycolatopsis sp. FDAARGOS 1241]
MNTVPELFESIVARCGATPAVVDARSTLEYGDLNTTVNRLARRLIAEGVGPDSIVAVAVPKSNDLIVTMLAVLKAGGAYLPLDPAYPAERLSFMLSETRPALLVRTSTVDIFQMSLARVWRAAQPAG